MAWELAPEDDPTTWSVKYNDILYRCGDLVSTTGSETNIFPSGDANTVVSDWIDKAVNWYEETVGKTSSDITDSEEIDDAKTAIMNRVCMWVLQRAVGHRLRDRDYVNSAMDLIRGWDKENKIIVSRQTTVSGIVDYQEVEETWS